MSADSTESAVGVTWVVLLLLGIWMQWHRQLTARIAGVVLIVGPTAMVFADAWLETH
jgi:hypothetical protein